MKETWIEQFTRGFFWIGYGVFLAASIPHIATYFRHFDPMITPLNTFYWIIGYALAIVIDISDVLISIAVIKAQSSGAKTRDLLGYWLFITFITALSWLINWQYNVVFGSSQFHTVDAYSVAGVFRVGQLNPVIGSAFQLLLLMYTGMAHKFSQKGERTEKSLETLQKEADEAMQRAALLRTIKDAEKQGKASVIQRLKGTALEAKTALNEVFSSPEKEIQEITNSNEISSLIEFESDLDVQRRPNTGPIVPAVDDELDTFSERNNTSNCDEQNEQMRDEISHDTPHEITAVSIVNSSQFETSPVACNEAAASTSRGPYYMTLEQAIDYTSRDEKYLKSRIKSGEILLSSNGKKVKVSSLERFKREKQFA